MINKNKIIENLLTTSWFIFSFVIVFFYGLFHNNPKIIAISFLLGVVFLFFYKKIKNKLNEFLPELKFSTYPFVIFGSILFLIWFLLLYSIFIYRIDFTSLLLAIPSITGKLVLFSLFFFIISLLLIACGRQVLSFIKIKSNEILLFFGVGLFIFLLVFFIFSVLGILNSVVVVSFFILMITVSFPSILRYLNLFFLKKADFNFFDSTDDRLKQWLVGLFFVFITSLFFILSFRALSINADDLSVYMNVPLVVADLGRAVPFYNSGTAAASGFIGYFYAALYTILPTYFVHILTPLFLFFTVWTVYKTGNLLGGKKTALMSLLLVVLVPWNVFFVQTQKYVYALSFFSVLGLYLIIKYFSDKNKNWLYLSGLFIGGTFLIKLNALFLIVGFCVTILFFGIRKYIPWKQIAITFFFLFMAMSPQLAINTYFYNDPFIISPFIYRDKQDTFFDKNKKINLLDLVRNSDLAKTQRAEYANLTRGNDYSQNPILNFFWKIWNTAVNQRGYNNLNVDIGFLFSIGLVSFIFLKRDFYKKDQIKFLSILFATGSFLWFLFGSGVTWYGISMVYILTILLAVYFEYIPNIIRRYINFFIVVQVIVFVFILSSWFVFNNHLNTNWLAGVDSFSVVKNDRAEYQIAQIINKEIDSEDAGRFLLVPDQRASFIKEANNRVIADFLSMYWSQIIVESDSYEDVANILKQQNITHIVYFQQAEELRQRFVVDGNLQDYELFGYFDELRFFVSNYMTEIYCNKTACVYSFKE